jgi:GNAT superfamily N-acetyltransferase
MVAERPLTVPIVYVADPTPRCAPVTASHVLHVRLLAYTDPLVRPMLAELSDEYSSRYGEGHGFPDLLAEQKRGAAEFGPPDGGVVLLIGPDGPISGGAFRRHDPETAELKRIWTAATRRRAGVARRTLAELEPAIAALGYRRIFLTTGWRQPEAVRLYLAAGYRPLIDLSLPSERVGKHAFEKELS